MKSCLQQMQRGNGSLIACRIIDTLTISAGLISQEAGNQIKELMKMGPVTLALNWTDALPKSGLVS
jgi:hypothetical protein